MVDKPALLMRFAYRYTLLAVVCLAVFSCTPKARTITKKDIDKSFHPLLAFMGVKPGVVLADVGAGSGLLTVAMSSLMDSAVIYVQDIDTMVLGKEKLDLLIDRYSKALNTDLRKKNSYHVTVGDRQHTRLPDGAFDFIFSNATAHVFDAPDSIFRDMGKKLKPDGLLFVRDSFKNSNGLGSVCSARACGKPLYSTAEFLELMERNNFKLVRQSPDMSGYPVFGFDYVEQNSGRQIQH